MAKIDIPEYIRKRQTVFILSAFAAVLVIALITWLSTRDTNEEAKVTVSPITQGSLTSMVQSTGTIASEFDKQFTAVAAGFYRPHPQAALGAIVKKGQFLGSVYNEKLIQDLQAAKIDHDFTLMEYKGVVKENDLNKKLFSQKAISQKDLDASNLAVNKYKLQTIVTSQKKLEEAMKSVTETKMIAPFNGTVVDAPLKADQAISASDKLMRIADLHALKALLLVSEYDFDKLSIGQSVLLHDGFLGSQTVKAKIGRIETVAKEVNGVRKLTVHCPIDMASIPQGLSMVMDGSVEGDIITGTKQKVIQVPKTAVVVENNAAVVFVLKGRVAEKRIVSLGIEGKNNVEITSGLNLKDQLISGGHLNLKNGQRVHVDNDKDHAEAGNGNELF